MCPVSHLAQPHAVHEFCNDILMLEETLLWLTTELLLLCRGAAEPVGGHQLHCDGRCHLGDMTEPGQRCRRAAALNPAATKASCAPHGGSLRQIRRVRDESVTDRRCRHADQSVNGCSFARHRRCGSEQCFQKQTGSEAWSNPYIAPMSTKNARENQCAQDKLCCSITPCAAHKRENPDQEKHSEQAEQKPNNCSELVPCTVLYDNHGSAIVFRSTSTTRQFDRPWPAAMANVQLRVSGAACHQFQKVVLAQRPSSRLTLSFMNALVFILTHIGPSVTRLKRPWSAPSTTSGSLGRSCSMGSRG